MKRSAISAVIAVAMIFACARINEAQSSDSSPEQTTPTAVDIPAGQVFIMQLDTPLNSRFTKKGEKVTFHTAADVVVDDQILIPNQSLINGKVTKATRAGIFGGRAELQLSFVDVKLPDGTVLPLQAGITRAGFDPVETKKGENSRLKGEIGTGGAIQAGTSAGAQGALIGMLNGGLRGAVYGAIIGASASTIGSMFKRGPDIDLPPTTMFEARFEKPLTIPAQSVVAQNDPSLKSAATKETASLNAVVDDPMAARRPILRRPQNEQQIEEVLASKPEPGVDASLTDMPTEEFGKNDRPVLRRASIPQTTEEASITKPESSPVSPPVLQRNEAVLPETADEGVKISVQVNMISVDAIVRDRSGRIMGNLTKEDFKVYDNNVIQEVAGFSQDKLPLAVAIVVDRSGSVTPYISELRYIASRALFNLKEQDEVCLFSFAQDVQLVEALTRDRQRIGFALNRVGGGGSTNILDALYYATKYLVNTAPDRRHAVILISDNEQTVQSMATERDVITMAQEKDTVIYSLKTAGSSFALGRQLPGLFSRDLVGKVAQESGGEVVKVDNVSSLDSALNTVITRLRTSYSIGYYPSNSQSGAFHSIAVRLADKFGKSGSDYSIQAKKGYYPVQSTKSVAGKKP
jgi:Ca-activated chloride channel homolog